MVLSAIPAELAAFAAANDAAGAEISESGSSDAAAMLSAAALAVGPIGAVFLAAYGPAQANTLSGALRVGAFHTAIGQVTQTASASFIAADNA